MWHDDGGQVLRRIDARRERQVTRDRGETPGSLSLPASISSLLSSMLESVTRSDGRPGNAFASDTTSFSKSGSKKW
jgi:hypothetical protein